MSRIRYEITGEWSGPRSPAGNYTAFQHREVTTSKSRADACRDKSILYTDGTRLFLSVRQLNKGERSGKICNGYGNLINQCIREGKWSVAELTN